MKIAGKLFLAFLGVGAVSYVAGCQQGRELERSLNKLPKVEEYQLRMIRDEAPDLFIKTSRELDNVSAEKTASFIDSVYQNTYLNKLREKHLNAKDSIAKAAKETVKAVK